MEDMSPAGWIRKRFPGLADVTDDELNHAAEKPSDSVYTSMDSVTEIILHHSATPDGSVEAFRSLHRAINGWADVGYHYVIGNGTLSGDGEIQKGRPEWAVGAHTRGHNHSSIGICLVGDFTSSPPTATQIEALRLLLLELMSRYELHPSDIMQHRDMSGCETECPGMDLIPSLGLLE